MTMAIHLYKHASICPHAQEDFRDSRLLTTNSRRESTCLWCWNKHDSEVINSEAFRSISIWDKMKSFMRNLYEVIIRA